MQSFIGYIDIGIIVFALIMLIIGWKCGFLNVLLKIANFLCSLIMSFVLCPKFADFLGLFFKEPIYNHYYNKVWASEKLQALTSEADAQGQIQAVLQDSGVPKFIAKILSKQITVDDMETFKEQIASGFGNTVSKIILTVIAFFVLLIGLTIIFFILKKILNKFRENKAFKYIDGTLGLIFYTVLAFAIVTILMAIAHGIANIDSVNAFFIKDMRLETGGGVPIARYFYEKNLLINIINLLF